MNRTLSAFPPCCGRGRPHSATASLRLGPGIRRKTLAFAAASIFVAALAGCSSVVQHPDFAQRQKHLNRIAVVTPRVEFHCQAPKSQQPLPEKEAELRNELLVSITRELHAKGFTAEFPRWNTSPMASNINDQAVAVVDALDRATARSNFYAAIRFQPPEKWATAQQKEDAQLLAKLANADAIAFLQLNGYTNTVAESGNVGARNFFGFLFAVGAGASGPAGAAVGGRGGFEPLYGRIGIQLMLVEGATGEPMWANGADSTDEHPNLDVIVKKLFEPLPRRVGATKEKKKRQTSAVPENTVVISEQESSNPAR